MNVDKIIKKAKQLTSTTIDDELLQEMVADGFLIATRGLSPASVEDIYMDDMLTYYLLSQISLINGDFALYNNYSALYNNALSEFRMIVAENAPAFGENLSYKNLFY